MTNQLASLVLELRGIHRFYFPGADNEISAVKDVSFSVRPGEFVAIIGPSGSGKSTLLSIMAGLDQPDGGSVWIDGERLSHRSRATQAAWRGSSIGVMTQSSGLLEHLNVGQNVDLGGALRRRARRDVVSERSHAIDRSSQHLVLSTDEILDAVGLGDRRSSRPSTLSGGETARANLAVALAGAPRILLADEPTAEISRSEERDILDLISSTRPPDGATVIVTHSESVANAADRVVEMQDGKVVY